MPMQPGEAIKKAIEWLVSNKDNLEGKKCSLPYVEEHLIRVFFGGSTPESNDWIAIWTTNRNPNDKLKAEESAADIVAALHRELKQKGYTVTTYH